VVCPFNGDLELAAFNCTKEILGNPRQNPPIPEKSAAARIEWSILKFESVTGALIEVGAKPRLGLLQLL
jgi:hypothetical protein